MRRRQAYLGQVIGSHNRCPRADLVVAKSDFVPPRGKQTRQYPSKRFSTRGSIRLHHRSESLTSCSRILAQSGVAGSPLLTNNDVRAFRARSSIKSKERSPNDRAWHDRYARIYASGNAGLGKRRQSARAARTGYPNNPWQHLSFVRQTWTRRHQTFRRPQQIHELGWPNSDG